VRTETPAWPQFARLGRHIEAARNLAVAIQNGGGLFQMKSMDFAEAEFYFFGWNKDISRNAKQLIEVRRGENSDIRIAVNKKRRVDQPAVDPPGESRFRQAGANGSGHVGDTHRRVKRPL
jgi:hypothetical protein